MRVGLVKMKFLNDRQILLPKSVLLKYRLSLAKKKIPKSKYQNNWWRSHENQIVLDVRGVLTVFWFNTSAFWFCKRPWKLNQTDNYYRKALITIQKTLFQKRDLNYLLLLIIFLCVGAKTILVFENSFTTKKKDFNRLKWLKPLIL